jgi:rSAM/selenodomain-associated transferase 1
MVEQHLLIFTRWPEAGKTKTRLIPALGPEGAAQLQKQLTEQTADLARSFLQQDPIAKAVTIFYTGASQLPMEEWLGADFNYQPQGTGDLGDRLGNGFRWAFDQGSQKVLVMGIDCPGITLDHLETAFASLNDFSMAIGPALDGGYYLLALKKFNPAYFQNIAWGTEQVYAQTLVKLQQNSAPPRESLRDCHYALETLPDIDRPADLKHLPSTFLTTT